MTHPCPGRTFRQVEQRGPKPGTELKRLLSAVGITPRPTCGCNAMAARMDAWGETCGDHIEEIVETMEREAALRGWTLPGLSYGMRGLVRLAIWQAGRSER